METKEIIRSNKWRNKIKVKHLFNDDTAPEHIAVICDAIIPQLKRIKAIEAKSNLVDDSKNHVDNELEELIGHFEFLKDFATGEIPESEWSDYDFNGDYKEMFNDYMSELYNLGDRRVLTKFNVQEKFMWVE